MPQLFMMATKQLASELREIYASDPSGAETAVEEFLDKQVSDLPVDDRFQMLDTLGAEFDHAVPGGGQGASSDDQAAARLLSLILGREITLSEIPAAVSIIRISWFSFNRSISLCSFTSCSSVN